MKKILTLSLVALALAGCNPGVKLIPREAFQGGSGRCSH